MKLHDELAVRAATATRSRHARVAGGRVILLALLVSLSTAACGSGEPARSDSSDTSGGEGSPETVALEVVAEADRRAAEDLWPGFDPTTTPVAIYTGENTLLFRHPAPPDGFREADDRPGVWTYSGRHSAVVANTSAELGGHRTATLLLADSSGRTVRSWASILVHEIFHVYQRENHPDWGANPAALFTYPVDAAELLVLRRLETEALRRAVEEAPPEGGGCWAATALHIRDRRFAAMPAEAVEYERGIELLEGLAYYIQHRVTASDESGSVAATESEGAPGDDDRSPRASAEVAGSPDDVGAAGGERDVSRETDSILPPEGFAPEAVRQRSSVSGLAVALLLDRMAPEWRRRLEREPDLSPDGLLAEAVADPSTPPPAREACEFDAAERESARTEAERDIDALRDERAERLRAYEERDGWRVVVRAPEEPLMPRGFDPVNVEVVDTGRVLHARFVQLGNESATIEIMDRAALTTAAGGHPLFDGVRTLLVTGLAAEPAVTSDDDGATRIEAEGLDLSFDGGAIDRSGQTIEVRLEP